MIDEGIALTAEEGYNLCSRLAAALELAVLSTCLPPLFAGHGENGYAPLEEQLVVEVASAGQAEHEQWYANSVSPSANSSTNCGRLDIISLSRSWIRVEQEGLS